MINLSSTQSQQKLWKTAISSLADSLRYNPADDVPDYYADWLRRFFPRAITVGFADHHKKLWEWIWEIEPGIMPQPFVLILSRGGGKSTSAELAIAALAARRKRRYFLYVRGTQDQADKSVSNIATLLEDPVFAESYPQVAERRITRYGQAKGWRRNRLMTASGATVDAYGLDSAIRGIKVDEGRPDFIIFDDVDNEQDTINTTRKKIERITSSILPAGSSDVAVLCLQNLMISNGFFDRMVNGTADYLRTRMVVGPIPAVKNLEYEVFYDEEIKANRFRITGGKATWEGQNLEVCENQMNLWGDLTFLAEAQHQVDATRNGTYSGVVFRYCLAENMPDFRRMEIWIDPAVSDNDDADAMGIQLGGVSDDNIVYFIYSFEDRISPKEVIRKGILKAVEYSVNAVGFETDQGGVLWRDMYYSIWDEMVNKGEIPEDTYRPAFKAAKAGSIGSKRHRHNMMRAAYDKGGIVHVTTGTFSILESALRRFPINKPYDLADAAFWCWRSLRSGGGWSRGMATNE